MANERINPLDPFGWFAMTKQQVDDLARHVGLPPLPVPPGTGPKYTRIQGVGGLVQSIMRTHRWTGG
jgi:hypothetical protein